MGGPMDDYDSYDPQYLPEPKHSGFGIASFLITLAAGLLEFVFLACVGVLAVNNPAGLDENSPEVIFLGLGLLGGFFLSILGLVLGIVGLAQKNRKKAFAAIGVVFGSLILLGVGALFLLGIAMG
jgi:hypothetical protein